LKQINWIIPFEERVDERIEKVKYGKALIDQKMNAVIKKNSWGGFLLMMIQTRGMLMDTVVVPCFFLYIPPSF